jgi:hypothetical protein
VNAQGAKTSTTGDSGSSWQHSETIRLVTISYIDKIYSLLLIIGIFDNIGALLHERKKGNTNPK